MNLINAKGILNEYRNQNYNSPFRDERELAQAIDKVLPRLAKLEELWGLWEGDNFSWEERDRLKKELEELK